jgi:hypothetical protein
MDRRKVHMWLQLLLELMTLLVPVQGAVTQAITEAHSGDSTGQKIVKISALAQRIVTASAPIIATIK